jgi:hypothetical protein
LEALHKFSAFPIISCAVAAPACALTEIVRAPAPEASRSKKHHDAHLRGAGVPMRYAMRLINAQRIDGSVAITG